MIMESVWSKKKMFSSLNLINFLLFYFFPKLMFSIIYVCLQEKKIFSKERNNPFCSSSKSGSPESLKKSALEKKKKAD